MEVTGLTGLGSPRLLLTIDHAAVLNAFSVGQENENYRARLGIYGHINYNHDNILKAFVTCNLKA